MAGEPLSYWDYVKAAFWKPVRSRVLGAMPLTQMLLASFGIAGFINPGFWLLGLAGIVAFVGGRSASERFQKLVEGERLLQRSGSAEDKMKAAYERLQPASQARYRALVVVCREVLGLGSGGSESSVSDFRAGNLNQMLWLFLRLLASREGITDTVARIDRRQLEAGIESLKSRLAAAPDPEGALARQSTHLVVLSGGEVALEGPAGQLFAGVRIYALTVRSNVEPFRAELAARGITLRGGPLRFSAALPEGTTTHDILASASHAKAAVVELLPMIG